MTKQQGFQSIKLMNCSDIKNDKRNSAAFAEFFIFFKIVVFSFQRTILKSEI